MLESRACIHIKIIMLCFKDRISKKKRMINGLPVNDKMLLIALY